MRREHREVPIKQGAGIRKSVKVFGQGQKTAKMIRAGLYARVSTLDQQTLPMQSRAMREYAVRRGWTIAMQVKEVGSGATQRQLREKLLDAARRREIDVVVVWRLDRWGRSVADLLATLQELEHLGVGFVSIPVGDEYKPATDKAAAPTDAKAEVPQADDKPPAVLAAPTHSLDKSAASSDPEV